MPLQRLVAGAALSFILFYYAVHAHVADLPHAGVARNYRGYIRHQG